MTRPRTYTLAEAAARFSVTTWTVRSWMRFNPRHPNRTLLEPVPGSWERLGYHLFTEPALVVVERERAAGRTRRKAHRAEPGRSRSVRC